MDESVANPAPRSPAGEIVMAAGVTGLGLFFLAGAWSIAVLPSYARIGPRFFPYVVGSGLTVTGILLLWQSLRPRDRLPAEPAEEDWAAVSWIGAALVANALLIERAGYVAATTVLFLLAARGLGERRFLRSGLAGLVIAVATYLAFTRLLDLHLPAGLLERVM